MSVIHFMHENNPKAFHSFLTVLNSSRANPRGTRIAVKNCPVFFFSESLQVFLFYEFQKKWIERRIKERDRMRLAGSESVVPNLAQIRDLVTFKWVKVFRIKMNFRLFQDGMRQNKN